MADDGKTPKPPPSTPQQQKKNSGIENAKGRQNSRDGRGSDPLHHRENTTSSSAKIREKSISPSIQSHYAPSFKGGTASRGSLSQSRSTPRHGAMAGSRAGLVPGSSRFTKPARARFAEETDDQLHRSSTRSDYDDLGRRKSTVDWVGEPRATIMGTLRVQEERPKTSAKSKFRKVAAVLTFTRRRQDMKELSPAIKTIVERGKVEVSSIDPRTGLPFRIGKPHAAQSLFSVSSRDSDKVETETLKTDIFESAVNTAYVVSDPLEKHYLIESTTNKLYAYFLSILAFASLLTSICTYSLQNIPELFSREIFYHFFWHTWSNILTIFFSLLLWAVLGMTFLISPKSRDWMRSLRKVRWILLVTPVLMMHFCHFGWDLQLTKLDDEFYPRLRERMIASLSGDNTTLVLSESYFQCCGVDGYQDWQKNTSRQFHGGISPTCCSGVSDGPVSFGCDVPVQSHTALGKLQVWPNGCLRAETILINTVLMLVYVILTAILISMYIALFYLAIAINTIIKHEITVQLPF